MALEKVYPPTDIAVLRKTGKMGDNQPALKIAPSKEKYDAQAHTFFQQRLQVLNKPQKTLNQERHLQKFEDERIRQANEAKVWHKDQLEQQFKIKQEIRAASINKLQRNAGFMEEWLQKGVEDWKKNQSIKKERERRELEFEYKQTERFNNLTMRKVDEANVEVNEGIASFEKTLAKNGIDPYVQKDIAERAVSESLQNSPSKSVHKLQKMSQSLVSRGPQNNMTTKFGGMTLTSTGLKGKDKKTITDQTRKERERRRRKMIVDQSKTLFEMDQKRRESQIVERMQRQAKQEIELGYEEWRTKQCKNVITENRKLREARYEKRRELDQQNANWREQEMIKSLEEQINRETEVLQNRDREMRIMHKQAKRESRTNFASELLDSIFEIANQAYIHQQRRDTEELDQRNWHEWMQLFVDQLPINPPSEQSKEQQQIAEEERLDEEDQKFGTAYENQQRLDHMELVDYLQNKGQWSETLITEYKVNLEQVLTGQGDQPGGAGAPPAKGGAKAPAAKVQVEQIQLEEGDTELPTEAPNNYQLGDAIETIININFEERAKQKRPIIPHHLTLKVCLIGYQFAGKKTQAERIREAFGLSLLQMSDLVQEAIQFANINIQPIENVKYIQRNEQEEQVDEALLDLATEPDIDVDSYNPDEDFRQCGLQIQEILLMGEEITDELYVKLFVSKLRMTFPYKTKKELYAESRQKVQKQRELERQIEEINQQLNAEQVTDQRGKRVKKRNPEELEKQREQLEKEIESLRQIQNNGWILVDFPSSFAQAKLLETALSGHIPAAESDPIKREIEQSEAGLLVKATEKELPPQKLIRSGIDSIIWFDCNLEKCMNRAIGRRFDETNEKMYHIQQQPPLTTNAPLCERLIPMNEEFNSEATLIDRWIAFDAHSRSLQSWLSQFGDAEIERCILSRVDANGSDEEVFYQINTILNEIIKFKQEKENQLRDVDITNKINEEEEQERERLRKIQEEEEQKLQEQEGAQSDRKEEPKKENKVEKPGAAADKIGPKPPSVSNIDNDVKPTLHLLWSQISANYKKQMKRSFKGSREQRERIIQRLHHIQQEFLHFLHRPDNKQDKLEQFIKDFNDFSDSFPDLREDDQTKEELHQRCDILSDELWEIIEDRKDQEIEERKKIMDSGWIEFELQFLVGCAQQLMQAEVDRFKGCIQLIHDYYHLFEDKLIPESPPQITTELGNSFQTQSFLVNEGEELPPVETLPEGQDQFNIDNYSYPRLDKIFERALKSQVVPDVTVIQASAQDKKGGAPPKGKDPKKPAQEEEKPQEESIYIKEMKKAIKVEKSLLRFRLVQIRNWTLKRLKEMRQQSLKVYSKLEDWIHVAVKTENDAIDEMVILSFLIFLQCIVIKKAIEEEKKIQDELRIKFMDFCVDEKIMNYIDPPPEKLPPLEQLKGNRFTIPQLRTLVEELEQISHELGTWPNIPNKVIVDLLVRKHENSKNFGDENGLPEEWKQFTEYNFQTIVRNLDKYNFGHINWKLFATFICLLESPILLDKEAETYQHDLVAHCGSNHMIDQENFINVKAWFDQYEQSEDREYSIPFPRVQYIKELLFKINKEEKGGASKINVKKLISLLKAKEITMFKRSLKVYADILLSPIEK